MVLWLILAKGVESVGCKVLQVECDRTVFEQKKEEGAEYDKTAGFFVAEPGFILYNGKILEEIRHDCV